MATTSSSSGVSHSAYFSRTLSLDQRQMSSSSLEQKEETTTALQTYLHLVKGYIGPGCLSLPWAFSKLGIVGGTVACIILSLWSSYNCWIVVVLKRQYLGGETRATYPQVADFLMGKPFSHLVTLGICVQQMSVCTVFLSFCGENILAAIPTSIHHTLVITMALPAVLALSCIPNLKRLSWATLAGTTCLSFALTLLFVVMCQHDVSDRTPTPTVSLLQIPLAMCAILYAYEGICLILPIEGAMKSPQHFGYVFWAAMATACAVFCAVAASSVAVFGNVENGSITAFLLQKYHLQAIAIANTFVSVSVILTYPLQLYPALELVGAWVERRGMQRGLQPLPTFDELAFEDDDYDNDTSKHSGGSTIPGDSPMLRLGLVMFTYLLAIVVPNVQELISLSGALSGSSTALLIPPLMQLQSERRSYDGLSLSKIKCYISFLLGLVFCVIGTASSIADIIRSYAS